MAVTRVMTIRDLRAGLAQVVQDVQTNGPVFAGAHRKPEVVIMSVQDYERLTPEPAASASASASASSEAAPLTARQQQDLDSTLGTMQMEGLPLPEPVVAELRELIAGRITFDEYRRRVGV